MDYREKLCAPIFWPYLQLAASILLSTSWHTHAYKQRLEEQEKRKQGRVRRCRPR